MTEEQTTCSSCGRQIRLLTAQRRNGMCVPCFRESGKPTEEKFADQVFQRIDDAIEPFKNYKSALAKLRTLPRGYALCFAFHHVHSEISNGGISQLYANSTWALVLDAEEAARMAGVDNVADLLRESIYYYLLKGRSKLKRAMPDDFFDAMPASRNKSLDQLDDQYFAVEDDANNVILRLCRDCLDLFDEA